MSVPESTCSAKVSAAVDWIDQESRITHRKSCNRMAKSSGIVADTIGNEKHHHTLYGLSN